MGYELIDHTADMGVRVRAKDLSSLFRDAALALVHITGASSTGACEAARVSVEGIDREDLLVRWLQELLYLIEARHMRISDIRIARLLETGLEADVSGVREETPLAQEIKAITYHHLDIEYDGAFFEATVIFDV